MRIRGGAGLGDAIYLRVVAEYLQSKGREVVVCSDYPDVFEGAGVKVEPFRKLDIDQLCHYTAGKPLKNTTQWQDILNCARITDPVPLTMKWEVKNTALIEQLRAQAGDRPIFLLHGGRTPMNRTDGFGRELMPNEYGFIAVFDSLYKHHRPFFVAIGKGPQLYEMPAADVDLREKTSISDLFDLASSCDGVVTQCSYVVPLAEVFDKPMIVVWASAGMQPGVHMYIRQIVPEKILEKPTSVYVFDNWKLQDIDKVCHDFRA